MLFTASRSAYRGLWSTTLKTSIFHQMCMWETWSDLKFAQMAGTTFITYLEIISLFLLFLTHSCIQIGWIVLHAGVSDVSYIQSRYLSVWLELTWDYSFQTLNEVKAPQLFIQRTLVLLSSSIECEIAVCIQFWLHILENEWTNFQTSNSILIWHYLKKYHNTTVTLYGTYIPLCKSLRLSCLRYYLLSLVQMTVSECFTVLQFYHVYLKMM